MMGMFSWCTSDTRKSIPCSEDAFKSLPTTVYLLNPLGEPYKETEYDGVGTFGGRDVYELVVEWNREYLTADNIAKPKMPDWACGDPSEYEGDSQYEWEVAHYEAEVKRYDAMVEAVQAYAAGASDTFMKKTFGEAIGYSGMAWDWKRLLGIRIASRPEEHVKLKYPIKIVEKPVPYELAGISPECPFQGCDYPRRLKDVQAVVDRAFERLAEEEIRWKASFGKMPLDAKIQEAEKSKDNLKTHVKDQNLGER